MHAVDNFNRWCAARKEYYSDSEDCLKRRTIAVKKACMHVFHIRHSDVPEARHGAALLTTLALCTQNFLVPFAYLELWSMSHVPMRS